MTYNELFEQVKKKKSFLCVGLDSDIKKLPQHLMGAEDPVYEFNKAIVDATADVAIAYKPNIAFYESNGDFRVDYVGKNGEIHQIKISRDLLDCRC